jgi:acetyl-CoA/propionyl-CoA carboxylase biotin carboxyl carrier protein
MFDTVLVANRGEIAVRILSTLRRLGIRSVAVYSDADQGARHVAEADIAIRLGPAPPHESYLHVARILDAAASTGTQAVHPGYGFLAENAAFARACGDAGCVFVGPSPDTIDLMGDKIRAKQTVAAAGVPTVPGRAEHGMSNDDLVAAAAEIGFPVLIKPSAGGGGKGMRLVEHADQLPEAIAGARRVAASSFGDDTLFIERFVEHPRHIEVQVFADAHGSSLHLGERECSLQRRHQKVMEEAPSPLLDEATRQRLGAAAVSVARSVGYAGAGTVEFIVAAERPDEFFFMEMNTRLQVEHAVTEMVTGLDLVEHQLRVAAGEPLGFGPDDVHWSGHAIEARVYAEDPGRNFLPTGGRILVVREPSGEGIRVDSSLVPGLEIATTYDPMLSKVISWGPDRATALVRLQRALAETVVLGAVSNVSFLRALAEQPDVVAGRLDTEFIERQSTMLIRREPPAVAYAAYALLRLDEASPSGPLIDAWDVPSGWRPGRDRPLTFTVSCAGVAPMSVAILGTPSSAEFRLEGGEAQPASLLSAHDRTLVTLAGRTHRVWAVADGATYWIFVDGDAWALSEEVIGRTSGVGGGLSDGDVRSPMPGAIIHFNAAHGEQVRTGQALLVVEAMKMEHVLNAPRDGVVDFRVTIGDQVVVNQVIAHVRSLEASESEEPSGASKPVLSDQSAPQSPGTIRQTAQEKGI